MTPEQSSQLTAIYNSTVGSGSTIQSLLNSIKSDVTATFGIVDAKVTRGGQQISQKDDNAATNTLARNILNKIREIETELGNAGFNIGTPDIVNYELVGQVVRTELDKTRLTEDI
jgi:hypothetical protein